MSSHKIKELKLEDAKQQLLKAAEASSKKALKKEAKEWIRDLTRLTERFDDADFRAIGELFGQDRAFSVYDVFPAESLAVTGAFIKVVKVNRLNSLLAYAPSELTPAQDAAKTSWESTVASILESLLRWIEEKADPRKAKLIAMVGPGVYPAVCSFLSDMQRARIGSGVVRAILELIQTTLVGSRTNKEMLSDPRSGLLKPRPLGQFLQVSTALPFDVQSTLSDIVAHLNPRLSEIERREQYADAIFGSFGLPPPVLSEAENLLITSPNAEWFQTRAKLMAVLAEWDVNRLQLFPLEAACQEGIDLLDNQEDRDAVEDGLKHLFFDSNGIALAYWTSVEDATLVLPFRDIVNTTFINSVEGAAPVTILSVTTREKMMLTFTLRASRASIQRVCANRPFATPIESPQAPIRSSIMAGGPFELPEWDPQEEDDVDINTGSLEDTQDIQTDQEPSQPAKSNTPPSPAPPSPPPPPKPARPKPRPRLADPVQSAKPARVAPLPPAPKKASPKKNRPLKPASNVRLKLNAAAQTKGVNPAADSDSELSPLPSHMDPGSSRPASTAAKAGPTIKVALPKRKSDEHFSEEEDRPRKRTKPSRATSPPPRRTRAVGSDDSESDELDAHTLAPPPPKSKPSSKKVYKKRRTPEQTIDDLDEDDESVGEAAEKEDWDEPPAPARGQTAVRSRREPLPRKTPKPQPKTKTPKQSAAKKERKPPPAKKGQTKAATSTSKKRVVSEDDGEDEDEQPRPTKKKATPAPTRPPSSTPARSSSRRRREESATSEAAPSEISSSQSVRPKRKAAVKAMKNFSTHPTTGLDDLEESKEEENAEIPAEPYIEDVWSRGKLVRSKVILPSDKVQERQRSPEQPVAPPSPPPADFYPPDDDNMADVPLPPQAVGPTSSRPFVYQESQAVISNSPSQKSDEMDIIDDPSLNDATDLAVNPMPSPLAEDTVEDESTVTLDEGRKSPVGRLAADSVPISKKRISSSAEQKKDARRAAVTATADEDDEADGNATITDSTPKATIAGVTRDLRSSDISQAPTKEDRNSTAPTSSAANKGPLKPTIKKKPKRVVDSDESEEIEEESPSQQRESSEEIEDDDDSTPPARSTHKDKSTAPHRSALKPTSDAAKIEPASVPSSQRAVRINSKPDFLGPDEPTKSQGRTKPISQSKHKSDVVLAPEPPRGPASEQSPSSSAAVSTISIVNAPSAKATPGQEVRPTRAKELVRPASPLDDAFRLPLKQSIAPEEQVSTPPQSSPAPNDQASSPPPPPVKAPAAMLVPTESGPSRQEVIDRQRTHQPSPTLESPPLHELEDEPEIPSQVGRSLMSTPRAGVAASRETSVTPAAPRKSVQEEIARPLPRKQKQTDYKKILLETVDELDRRRTKRESHIKAKAAAIKKQLISDSRAIATRFEGRTEVIVNASANHRTVLEDLDSNMANTTRKARQKTDDVVKAVTGIMWSEKRAMENWPSAFFGA